MTITQKDAEAALNSVEEAKDRLNILASYRHGAPYFVLWGLVWFFAYMACDFLPDRVGIIWALGDVIGIGGSVALGVLRPRRRGRFEWRWFAEIAVLAVFAGSVLSIMRPANPEGFAAFFSLLFGLLYMVIGLWFGMRLFLAGLVVTLAAVGGYFLLKEHYYAWLAVFGGGAFFLTGLWLRRA